MYLLIFYFELVSWPQTMGTLQGLMWEFFPLKRICRCFCWKLGVPLTYDYFRFPWEFLLNSKAPDSAPPHWWLQILQQAPAFAAVLHLSTPLGIYHEGNPAPLSVPSAHSSRPRISFFVSFIIVESSPYLSWDQWSRKKICPVYCIWKYMYMEVKAFLILKRFWGPLNVKKDFFFFFYLLIEG